MAVCRESFNASLLIEDDLVSLIRAFGGGGSDAVLEPGTQFFQVPNIRGFIGYRLVMGRAIVFGDPVCAAKDRAALAIAFHKAMPRVIYIGVSKAFARFATEYLAKASMAFGKELIFDPTISPRERSGTHASLVRRKYKRAVKERVEFYEYTGGNPLIEAQLVEAGRKWKKGRKGRQVHISDLHLFDNREGKRWFYAMQGRRIVGSISANRLEEKQGWLLNHLFATPGAPKGTSEFLFVSALERLREEGCQYASVGFISAGEISDLRGFSPLTSYLAPKVYALANKYYGLDGLNTYWGKFHPSEVPIYLLFSEGKMGLFDLLALRRALHA